MIFVLRIGQILRVVGFPKFEQTVKPTEDCENIVEKSRLKQHVSLPVKRAGDAPGGSPLRSKRNRVVHGTRSALPARLRRVKC